MVNQLNKHYPKKESKTKIVEEENKYRRINDHPVSKKQVKRPKRRLASVTQGK